jgi:hypothetical protein
LNATPIRKLVIGADSYFGPGSGLGALDYGHLGPLRLIAGAGFHLPVQLPAPFVWELHISALIDIPRLGVSLAEPPGAGVLEIALTAGQKAEVIGIASAGIGPLAPSIGFRFLDVPAGAGLMFLGLSLLPLVDYIAAAPPGPSPATVRTRRPPSRRASAS